MTADRTKHTTDFHKALACLERALERPMTSRLERVGLVKFYDLAYWQAWQVLRDELVECGTPAFGPDDSVRKALQIGLIHDRDAWQEMVLAEERFMQYFIDDELEKATAVIRTRYYPALQETALHQ
ncbi:MAG: nucleotidyltransferase substrate binding protein [Flavobacteriales bacterium]|nr:nucleotidyltransferase substrate binding protein [Flavobacteriales bacterium]